MEAEAEEAEKEDGEKEQGEEDGREQKENDEKWDMEEVVEGLSVRGSEKKLELEAALVL